MISRTTEPRGSGDRWEGCRCGALAAAAEVIGKIGVGAGAVVSEVREINSAIAEHAAANAAIARDMAGASRQLDEVAHSLTRKVELFQVD